MIDRLHAFMMQVTDLRKEALRTAFNNSWMTAMPWGLQADLFSCEQLSVYNNATERLLKEVTPLRDELLHISTHLQAALMAPPRVMPDVRYLTSRNRYGAPPANSAIHPQSPSKIPAIIISASLMCMVGALLRRTRGSIPLM